VETSTSPQQPVSCQKCGERTVGDGKFCPGCGQPLTPTLSQPSQQNPNPVQNIQKPYWTNGKIIALVLVALLIVGVSGVAAFNYLNNRPSSPSGSSDTCSNGATNPPSCTSSPCSNRATNYPQCTTFTTSATLTCTPSKIVSHSLNSTSCDVKVFSQAPTVSTGNVGFTASGVTSWYFSSSSANPCVLKVFSADTSYCTISGVSTVGPSGTMVLNAAYGGDGTHVSSTGTFNIQVIDPPSTVTVSGSVSTVGAGTSPYKIEFDDTSTGVGTSTTVNSESYSISLTNLRTYNVIVFWTGVLGSSGTCNGGTLTLQSPNVNWYANYSC
jgi:hypothetical protein